MKIRQNMGKWKLWGNSCPGDA